MSTNHRILRDLGVFHPEPRGYVTVRIDGRDPINYPVLSVIDMKEKAVLRLMALDSAPQTNWEEQSAVLYERIRLVCPDMTDETLDEMTRREKSEFWLAALRERPPSVLGQLSPLLDMYDRFSVPCPGEECEHPDCWAIRKLWEIKEGLAARMDPLPSAETVTAPSLASASSTS